MQIFFFKNYQKRSRLAFDVQLLNKKIEAKFHLSCFQRFGNRFCDAKGGISSLNLYEIYVCTFYCTFFKPFGKNPRICSTGLETGCKPVLFFLCHGLVWAAAWMLELKEVWMLFLRSLHWLFCLLFLSLLYNGVFQT